MKKLIVFSLTFSLIAIMFACGGNDSKSPAAADTETTSTETSENPSYDPKRGEGKFTTVEVGPLNETQAEQGNQVFQVKCSSCHKLTDEKLVGPGWKGVTERRRPEWIMNFITNTDPMIDKDPELQAQLELCLVRMPNQNVSDDDARALLEFMRKNDGVK